MKLGKTMTVGVPAVLVVALAVYLLLPRSLPAKPLPAASNSARDTARAVNAFAFDLYHAVRGRPGNLCLSPYSIHSVLVMVHDGAGGRTAEQMGAALHLNAESRAGERGLHGRLQAAGNHGFELAVANRLWLDRSASVVEGYRRRLAEDFLAEVEQVDFRAPTALDAINAWTSQRTKGRIPGVLESRDLPVPTALVVTNALYFKGNWDIPFEKAATAEGDFHTAPGAKVPAMLMHQNKKHPYGHVESVGSISAFRVLSLDYTGGDLAMLLLLPELGQIEALEHELSTGLVDQALASLNETWVPVTLPRFTLQDSFSLKPALQSLGMKDVFDGGAADLSGMSPQALRMDGVYHKTFVRVNEEGTEAAAVTAGVVQASEMPMVPPEFKADHPFVFLIRDKGSGAIVFLGRVSVP